MGLPLRASLFDDRELALFTEALRRHQNGRSSRLLRRRIETFAHRASGERFPIEVTIAPAGSGNDLSFTAFMRDISERRLAESALEQREKRFRTIVEKSWSGVVLLDGDLRFSYAGSSTSHLIGYEESELLGRSLFD